MQYYWYTSLEVHGSCEGNSQNRDLDWLIQQDSPRAMTAQDLKHFKARFQRIPSLPSSCCTCIFFILSLTLSRFQHAFWQSDNQPWSGKSTHGLNGWVSGFVVTHRCSVTRLWPSETEATLRIAYHRSQIDAKAVTLHVLFETMESSAQPGK